MKQHNVYMARACFLIRLKVGSNTKSSWAALAAMLLMAVSLSGCIYIENMLQPAPTLMPVVTITATPSAAPTPTPAPTPGVRHSSPDVKVMPVMDKGVIAFSSYQVEDLQYENITIVLANDGTSDAKNVVVTLIEIDAHGGNTLVQQKFKVGDMKRGDRKDYTLVTEKHEQAASVMITANLEWGEAGEYYNPTTFIGITKSIIWMVKF
jgi:hypothetical protein